MNNLLKLSLITAISIHITGCSVLRQAPEIDYIIPVQDVSLKVGESAIVNGAIDLCGQDSLRWSDISIQLPISETGFFSNAGQGVIQSKRCGADTNALKVRFTANKVGSESLTVFGEPLNIVVSAKSPVQQSRPSNTSTQSTPNIETIGTENNSITFLPPKDTTPSAINTQKTDASEESSLDTFFKWISRDADTQ